MKCCDYCGKENEEALLYCLGCGTELLPPKTVSESVPKPRVSKVLNAKWATVILLVFILAQGVGGIIGGLFGLVFTGWSAFSFETLRPFVVMAGLICGAITLVWITRAFGFRFHDISPFGPAWVRGSCRDIGIGFAMGILIYAADWVLLRLVPYTRVPMDPTTRMILRHGFPRICAVIACLLFAPIFEEMAIRGVAYAGYRRSFGPIGAAALTTFLFVLMHEPLYRQTRILQLTTISLAAVWLRLRSRAIGPAIAQHFAYNACVIGMLIFWHG